MRLITLNECYKVNKISDHSLVHTQISTMPPDPALKAFMDHGILSRTIDAKVSEAENTYNAIETLGIDWSCVGSQLENEVLDSFKRSFENVIECLGKKARMQAVDG